MKTHNSTNSPEFYWYVKMWFKYFDAKCKEDIFNGKR